MDAMHLPRRYLVRLVVAAALVGSAGGAAAWWYRSTRPEYRLRQGREALQRGDRDEAERMAQLLLADGHADAAHLLRGEALFRQQQYDRAITELNRIHSKEELRVDAALILAQCLLLENQREQAERAFQFVLYHRPDNVIVRRCLTGIYYMQGAPMRAVEQATEWGKLEERNGQPYQMMGHIYRDLGEAYLPEAIDSYREALRRDLRTEGVEEVRHELAECLVRSFQWSEALAALDGPDQPLPATAERQALRVRCLWGLGRGDDARALLDQGLAEHPRSLELLQVGAEIRQADKRFSEAATLLEQALDIDNHDHESRHKLALVYEALGRRADAAEQRRLEEKTKALLKEMETLREQAANDPWNAAPHLRLAQLCTELGRDDWAKMARDAAKACGPTADK
jgi:tetratricopeptide (TPR) repeat protein